MPNMSILYACLKIQSCYLMLNFPQTRYHTSPIYHQNVTIHYQYITNISPAKLRFFHGFHRVGLFFSTFFLLHVFPATAFFTVRNPFGRTRQFGLAKNRYLYHSISILALRYPRDFKIFYQTVRNLCTIL